MLFAIVVERPPTVWKDLLPGLMGWLEVVGGISLLAMVVYGLIWLVSRRPVRSKDDDGRAAKRRARSVTLYLLAMILSVLLYAAGGTVLVAVMSKRNLSPVEAAAAMTVLNVAHILLAAGGLMAILGVVGPVLANLPALSPRRIFALAKLSFKEAIRRKVLVGFSSILIVFLFASWFVPYKPEDQVRNYVELVYTAMWLLLLLTAGLLASFGIPSDMKTQTMYTIVTKPVERFEIVLGRCLGYTFLMTLVLLVMGLLSLIYVRRNLDPEAVQESYKARVPIFSEGWDVKGGVSVGREWGYRSYIQGGVSNMEAIWSFPELPAELAHRRKPTVPCEFSFDIFRTTKGKEGKGVRCTFIFYNWKWDRANEAKYRQELQDLREDPELVARARAEDWTPDEKRAALRSQLAAKYGIYELNSKEIFDYHTLAVEVPTGLFQGLEEYKPTPATATAPARTALAIHVRCEDPTQYLGVAKHDLYLLSDERSFEVNFLKGAIGLWCQFVLVIVVAVALSTYLSGIISFIVAMLLYFSGWIVDFIRAVAEGRAEGGGPLEATMRLFRGANLMSPLEQTTTTRALLALDVVFRIFLRPLLLIIPDVSRFDLRNYVAEGFDIPFTSQLLPDNIVPLLGYVIPWLVLAFYLMRSREIAS
jgi:ABC-type transport system involved in multi-copper enzyme maturation permease subunit